MSNFLGSITHKLNSPMKTPAAAITSIIAVSFPHRKTCNAKLDIASVVPVCYIDFSRMLILCYKIVISSRKAGAKQIRIEKLRTEAPDQKLRIKKHRGRPLPPALPKRRGGLDNLPDPGRGPGFNLRPRRAQPLGAVRDRHERRVPTYPDLPALRPG